MKGNFNRTAQNDEDNKIFGYYFFFTSELSVLKSSIIYFL